MATAEHEPKGGALSQTFALSALEKLINASLKYDPATCKRMAALEGKIIAVKTSTPKLSIYVLPQPQGLTLLSQFDGEVDTRIEGPASELAKQMSASTRGQMIGGKLKIQGDNQLAQEIQAIAQDLEIDWEEPLSKYVGDIAAHEIGRGTRQLVRWFKRAGDTLKRDLSEYLNYESQITVPDFCVADFIEQVDQLRFDVDRIEARIQRLENLANQANEPPPAASD